MMHNGTFILLLFYGAHCCPHSPVDGLVHFTRVYMCFSLLSLVITLGAQLG